MWSFSDGAENWQFSFVEYRNNKVERLRVTTLSNCFIPSKWNGKKATTFLIVDSFKKTRREMSRKNKPAYSTVWDSVSVSIQAEQVKRRKNPWNLQRLEKKEAPKEQKAERDSRMLLANGERIELHKGKHRLVTKDAKPSHIKKAIKHAQTLQICKSIVDAWIDCAMRQPEDEALMPAVRTQTAQADDTLNNHVKTLLEGLRSLQSTAYKKNKEKLQLRPFFVSGFSQVSKHLKLQHMPLLVIVANDLDVTHLENGPDQICCNIIDSCHLIKVPVAYPALSRRKLGKTLHMRAKVSVIAILRVETMAATLKLILPLCSSNHSKSLFDMQEKNDTLSNDHGDLVILTASDIDKAFSLKDMVASPSCGAISTFLGITRDNFRGKSVTRLEYEAYTEMALKQMQRVITNLRECWDVYKVVIIHRVGYVPVMETSIAIAVSSAHRAESLKAVEYAIDSVKNTVPIWKKEVYEDGAIWKSSCDHSSSC